LFFALQILVNAFVHIALPATFGDDAGGGATRVFAVILGLLILFVVFVFVLWAVRRMARPIGEVMDAADRVAAGDYGVRVDEHGWREMRRLARSFNAMTERLGSNEEQRRNLLADLAHELRTPLSVIQGNVEGMLDGLYPGDRGGLEPILEETRVMSRLLDDLEILSRAEAGVLRLHRERTEPGRLVEDAIASSRSEASAADVRLEQRVTPGLPALDVDPVRIGQVFSNMLSNAVRHSPPGTSVEIAAESANEGRAVSFTVRDTGPGIPPEQLPHIFDRFVKSADSGGTGLGLAIAKSLVQAHGGEIEAESEPGTGTTMRFVLPL
jgi:two-component system OmpR family sensor kinase/two-component system sensor histidine kinase BaeS